MGSRDLIVGLIRPFLVLSLTTWALPRSGLIASRGKADLPVRLPASSVNYIQPNLFTRNVR